ncbi:small heat shock protein, chloroplastic [Amborella trichopoda]|uniref:SHSP domain-containing protein n=1 Tax=Amborella trichopoda TaxID=13333 RepID=W1PZV6_AMBTC|nr:small heat shock protein, chloroplastic [Amborella trichopoda]ERN13631.1 hypothetical protein AMTR_s00049p00091290 [Amborella trichopoda]|eukprot:XP_006852164.1 small heat shock protein, chloroplastic [Amborella trichopoda]
MASSLWFPMSTGRSPFSLSTPDNNGGGSKWSSKRCSFIPAAMADGRDSLDHLQKAPPKVQSPHPKKRTLSQPNPNIGIWDTFPSARTVRQMMDTMDQLMEEPFAYSPISRPSLEQPRYRGGRTPWDIQETDEEFRMRFDMPGMTKRDVKVCVEEGMLVVKAEKLEEREDNTGGDNGKGGEWWSAKSYGRYSSRIALPENVEIEKIKAEVRDGVLYISIPKAKVQSKVLDVDVQ